MTSTIFLVWKKCFGIFHHLQIFLFPTWYHSPSPPAVDFSIRMSQERNINSSSVLTSNSGELGAQRQVSGEIRLQETSPHIQLKSAEILAMTAGEEEVVIEGTPVVIAEDSDVDATRKVGAALNGTTKSSDKNKGDEMSKHQDKDKIEKKEKDSDSNDNSGSLGGKSTGAINRELSSRSQTSSKGVTTARDVGATLNNAVTEADEEGVALPPTPPAAGVIKRELSSLSQKNSKGVTIIRKLRATLNGTTSDAGEEGVTLPPTEPPLRSQKISKRVITGMSGSSLERQTSAPTVPGAVAVSGNSAGNDVENPASPSTSDDDFDYVTSPPVLTVTATAISIQELEDEMRDRILGQPVQAVPEPATPIETNDSKTSRHRKLLYVLVCACVTVAVVVAVAVGVIVGTRDDSDNKKPPRPPPRQNGGGGNNSNGTTKPGQTALQTELLNTLSQISPDKGLALETPTSPQFRAFKWLGDTDYSDYSIAELSSRYAMAVLYHSTDGPNWANQDLWLSSSSICDWYGDTPLTHCDGGSFRRQFILNNNNLKGSLPPELALLGENLQELDLSFNSLTGAIPSEIARLTGLTRFVLQSNSLTGSAIPLEMSTLTRLRVFDVKLNRELAGSLPPEMGAWTDLRDFNVESTAMNGPLPSAIGNWTNLESWYSRRVKWDGPIPSEVGLMSSLKELDMAGAGGSIYGPIPEEIYNITSLRWLALTRTGVQGTISTAIGHLTSLDRLHLGINRLTGTIPSQIEKLTSLRELYLDKQVSVDDYLYNCTLRD
jgi:hypothetical protein